MKNFAATTVNTVKPVYNNDHPWDTEFVAVVGKCFLEVVTGYKINIWTPNSGNHEVVVNSGLK
jgi:hypothetical protein